MEIQIVEQIRETLQVIIKCNKRNEEVERLKVHIESFEEKLQAKMDDEIHLVNVSEVLYFESVENHIYLYTEEHVMEIKQRLYELEYMLSEKDFIRISKSLIVNVNKITALRPELNRTILATMCNGEKLTVSRRYVQSLRKMLSI